MADAVTETHEAHAAAQHVPAGSTRTFLGEAALLAVRALKGAGAPTLLPAMHQIVNAIRPGPIGPGAALYGSWMEWCMSNRSGRPLSMGDTLRLTCAGSATPLHSSAPALLRTLRTGCPRDAAPYLTQARATYPGGVSKLEAALHLLHSLEEDLEVDEVTIFVEGASEMPTRPRRTNLVSDGTRPTPPIRCCVRGVPQRAHLVSRPPTGHEHAARLNQPAPAPPPLQDQGCPPERTGPLARAPGQPPAPPRRHDPRGPGACPGGHPHPPLRESARAPPPPSGARGAGRGARLPAITGDHRRYGGPPCAASPGVTRRHRGAQGHEPHPRLEAVARCVGRVARPPPTPVPVMSTDPCPLETNTTASPSLPSPPPPCAALQGPTHGTPLMH